MGLVEGYVGSDFRADDDRVVNFVCLCCRWLILRLLGLDKGIYGEVVLEFDFSTTKLKKKITKSAL